MTLNMLQYFISVAECGSFTEAAAACFVSQPALSRAIANLEKEIGCTLLDRDGHKTVRLTSAGEVLLVEARRILGQVDIAVQRVRRADASTHGVLTLGYIAYGMLRCFRQAAGQALESLCREGIRIETVYGAAPELKERLLSGELDCLILPEMSTIGLDNCTAARFVSQRYTIMVPKGHPLFHRECVSLSEFSENPFVFYDPQDLPMITAKHIAMCGAAGFTPKIAGYGHKLGDITDIIHQTGGVSITTEAFGYAESDDIRVIPLSDQESTAYVIAARQKPVNPAVSRLLSLLDQST